MIAALITGPAIEPVSLDEAKAHLRVDGDDDDDPIAAAIAAARRHVEATTRRVLVAQGWRAYFDAWPRGRLVPLPVAPLMSIDTVTVYDSAGEPAVIPAGDYAVDAVSVPGRLLLKPGIRRPGRDLNGIEIELTAGYGENAEDVPAPLRHAILMLVAHWYENRAAAGYDGPGVVTPLGFDALVAPYRVLSL